MRCRYLILRLDHIFCLILNILLFVASSLYFVSFVSHESFAVNIYKCYILKQKKFICFCSRYYKKKILKINVWSIDLK